MARRVITIGSGNPSSPANGDVWYNQATGKLMGRQAGANVVLHGLPASYTPDGGTQTVVGVVAVTGDLTATGRIYSGDSEPLNLGSSTTTSRGLGAGSVMIGGSLEVNNVLYADLGLVVAGTSQLVGNVTVTGDLTATGRIYSGDSDPLNLGNAATTNHGLGAGSVIVGSALEVENILYADNDVYIASGMKLYFTGSSGTPYLEHFVTGGSDEVAARTYGGGSFAALTGDAFYLRASNGTQEGSFIISAGSSVLSLDDLGWLAWSSTTGVGGTKDVGLARSAPGRLKINDGNYNTAASGELELKGSLIINGYTATAADPTTTELSTSKMVGIHKNTSSGDVFLAFNDGGAIKKILLT